MDRWCCITTVYHFSWGGHCTRSI